MFLCLTPFLLGFRSRRSCRILLSRSLCAFLRPRTDTGSGEESKDASALPFSNEPSSTSLLSSSSPISSSSSSSSSSPALCCSGGGGRTDSVVEGSSWLQPACPPAPLPSVSLEKDSWSHDPPGEGSSSQAPPPLERSLFQAERPPFLL